MLSKVGETNLEIVKQSLIKVWGQRARIINIKVLDRPFDMFEIHLAINHQHDVMISYDRSIVDISVLKDGKYKWLTDMTDLDVIEGFDSCRPENLIQNFEVLDKVLNTK
jgi:hypothetical protein